MSTAPVDYSVQLSAFQGPLDLLLYLIRRAEVDIHDIPIAEITDQYLAFVKRDVVHVDMEEAGEFLVMAATLIEIKARTLAPKKPTGEDGDGEAAAAAAPVDPRTELVQALLSYQRYRRAAEELESRRIEFWQRHAIRIDGHRVEAPAPVEGEEDDAVAFELDDVHLLDLSDAYERIAGSIDFAKLGDHRVEYDDTPIALHQEDLLDRLAQGDGRVVLRNLFDGRTRMEQIGLFLATLELAKQRRVIIEQDDALGDVTISVNSDPEVTEATTGAL